MSSIYTGIPLGHSVNSFVDGYSVMNEPNAIAIERIQMTDGDGNAISGGFADAGNPIKVLEISNGSLLVLVPYGNDSVIDSDISQGTKVQWVIGYFDISVLYNGSLKIYRNTIEWNNSSNKTVYDAAGNAIYSLPATQTIQFLYETPGSSNTYACILFNDGGASSPLLTGYVPMNEGIFYRYQTVPNGPIGAPTIKEPSFTVGEAVEIKQSATYFSIGELIHPSEKSDVYIIDQSVEINGEAAYRVTSYNTGKSYYIFASDLEATNKPSYKPSNGGGNSEPSNGGGNSQPTNINEKKIICTKVLPKHLGTADLKYILELIPRFVQIYIFTDKYGDIWIQTNALEPSVRNAVIELLDGYVEII